MQQRTPLNVKKTMINTLFSLIAPHYCCGCGVTGPVLCENCKYDITTDTYEYCVACGQGRARLNGLCGGCKPSYVQAWCVANRRDTIERLINLYKFENGKSAGAAIAALMHDSLPQLPSSVRIVPVPTIATHIRQRGYDHMLLVARQLSRSRGLVVDTCLQRATSTRQRGASATDRKRQAKEAFTCRTVLDPDTTYLVIDDVVTTGSTLQYAAQTLLQAGARNVWVATLSRQPLD